METRFARSILTTKVSRSAPGLGVVRFDRVRVVEILRPLFDPHNIYLSRATLGANEAARHCGKADNFSLFRQRHSSRSRLVH